MSDAITSPKRAVYRNAADNLYYIYECQEDGSWKRSVGRGYRHSTSCYAQLGRIVSHESKDLVEIEGLLAEHIAEAESRQAEFLNLGWAQGPGFIHSKTDKGRLYTERKAGKTTHRWE